MEEQKQDRLEQLRQDCVNRYAVLGNIEFQMQLLKDDREKTINQIRDINQEAAALVPKKEETKQ
jgi:hypothetical protein